MIGRVFFLFFSFPSYIFLYMYLYSPPSSAAQIFVVVGDICMGWEFCDFGILGSRGPRRTGGSLYTVRQNCYICIYDFGGAD